MAHNLKMFQQFKQRLITLTAWKTTEAMYAQGEQGQGEAQPQGETAQGDNVEDVEFEVK
jgi:hypothetical protein